jgi:hypothetical protein
MVLKTLSQKKLSQKRAGGVAQGEGPEFKPQYCKKTKTKKEKEKIHSTSEKKITTAF